MTSRVSMRMPLVCAMLAGFLPTAIASADQINFQYDAAGRLQTATYPNGSVVNYTLDAAGNRKMVSCAPGSGTSDCTQKSKTTGTLTPKQLAAIQAVLSILLGQ
jgi:YD repeat-containing protein